MKALQKKRVVLFWGTVVSWCPIQNVVIRIDQGSSIEPFPMDNRILVLQLGTPNIHHPFSTADGRSKGFHKWAQVAQQMGLGTWEQSWMSPPD